MFKKVFGRKGGSEGSSKELTTEDLVVLERWDEAIAQLKLRTDVNPNDLHAHLKLAEVYSQAGRIPAAVDEYVFVAGMYTDDGFYDKAIALLGKVARIAPGDSSIEEGLRKAQQLKTLEHRRTLAIEGMLSAQESVDPAKRISLVDAQRIWQAISSSELVLRLTGEQLRRIFAHAQLIEATRGTILAERGAKIEAAYFVAGGTIEAVIDLGDGRPMLLRTLETGDVFGDRSLLEHQAWPATYRVAIPGRLFRLDPPGLEEALRGNPDPRQLLDALRSRRHDHDVAAAARKLVASSA
jgi:CRP-like cAMP-binding protein